MDKDYPVFRSLEQIENRIKEKLTVETIAEYAFFSKYYYQRLFREVVGDSVMSYVTKRKLTLAGKALLETDAPIIDIAVEFGYDSREGFTRSFKAYMGVSPMEYRKYGLADITQRQVKERKTMTYSITTDEIIRELNEFIVRAKGIAESARNCEVEAMLPFWSLVADKTDALAESIHHTLARVSRISEHPDEITNRFVIIKVIDDAAFGLNIILFNISIMVARNLPQHIEPQKSLCESYRGLAHDSALKARKIVVFFNELAELIFDDMRKTARDKIQTAIQAGKTTAAKITGYDYIKNEITYLCEELESTPLDDITVNWLDDSLYKLRIISFAAEADVCRMPSDKEMLDITVFVDKLRDAYEFFATIEVDEKPALIERSDIKFFMDVAYQGNIMLFYLRGEIEKLSGVSMNSEVFLDDKQKAAFGTICKKLDDFVHLAHNAAGNSASVEITGCLSAVQSDLAALADDVSDRGGAIRYISDELGRLAEVVRNHK